jgi:hypothetical protein
LLVDGIARNHRHVDAVGDDHIGRVAPDITVENDYGDRGMASAVERQLKARV